MGKANLDTKDAIDSVKQLITQIEKLNSSIGKIGGTNSRSFNELKNSVDSLRSSISTIKKTFTAFKNEVSSSTDILKTNSKRLTKNSKEVDRLGNLIKTNSKNVRANTTQVNKNTQAQNQNVTSKEKNTTATKAETDAYKLLVKETKKAESVARTLNTENRNGSIATEQATERYRMLKAELDRVNNAVKRTEGSYEKLVKETRRLKEEAQNLIVTQGRQSDATRRAIAAYDQSKNSMREAGLEVKKLEDSYTKLQNKVALAERKLKNLTIEQGKNSAATKKASAEYQVLKRKLDDVNNSTKKVEVSTKKANKSLTKSVAIGNLWAMALSQITQWATEAVRSVISLAIKFESLGYSLKAIEGSMEGAKIAMQFLMGLNKRYGAALITTTERWLKFRAAAKTSNFTLMETEQIFESVTKASAVLGLSTDELKGVYLALEQMISKGKVTTEELRRQLGERLPGAMGIMAESMGLTIAELDKMMKKGEVLTEDVLVRFAEQMEITFGIENVERVENLNTAVGRLEGTWQQFVFTVSEGDSVLTNVIGGTLEVLTDRLEMFIEKFETINQKAYRLSNEIFGKEISDGYDKMAEDFIKANTAMGLSEKALESIIKSNMKALSAIRLEGEKNKTDYQNDEKYLQILKSTNELLVELEDVQLKKDTYLFDIKTTTLDDAKVKLEELRALAEEGSEDSAGDKFVDILKNESGWEAISTVTELFKRFGETTDEERERILSNLSDIDRAFIEQQEKVIYLTKLEDPNAKRTKKTDPDETTTRSRKPRAAKLYTDDSKDEIDALKKVNVEYEVAYKQRATTLQQFEDFSKKIQKNKQEILDLEKEDELRALEVSLVNKQASWDATMRDFKGSESDKIKQQDEYDTQMEQLTIKNREERKNINAKYILADAKLEFETNEKKIQSSEDYYAIQKQLAIDEFKLAQAKRDAEGTGIASGSSNAESHETENLRAQFQLQEKLLAIEILRLKAAIAKADAQGLDTTDLENQLKIAEEGLGEFKSPLEALLTGDGSWQEWAAKGAEVMDALANATDALFQRRIDLIDMQIEKETEMFDKSLELAKNDEAEKKIIERNKEKRIEELEKKKRKEQAKQAKFNKANAIAQATISGFLAVNSFLSLKPASPLNFILAGIAGTIAAANVAAIAAQPIPRFAKGGVMEYDGVAQINDGGSLEYVERDGQIFTTPKTNALVNLQKDDIIHKDFDAFRNSNHSFFLDNGILGFGKSEMDLELITGAIERGFSKAKVNNNITVLNNIEDNSYRNKMSNWD